MQTHVIDEPHFGSSVLQAHQAGVLKITRTSQAAMGALKGGAEEGRSRVCWRAGGKLALLWQRGLRGTDAYVRRQ